MPLFEMNESTVEPVARTTFHQAGIWERTHLQAVLRDRIEVVVPDVLVVAEEFGGFQDANRRIDLLGVDRQGRLIVIELKRTEDGGHMELQALRYAAMVRTMTLGQLVDIYERHLELHPPVDGRELDARERLAEWLDDDEPALATEVAIVLVSADFGLEMTSTVLWLNEHGLDIRCVRLQPYQLDDRLLLDVHQVIPLPEASQYQVRLREKEVAKKVADTNSSWNHDLTKYVVTDASGRTTGPLPKRRAILRLAHAVVAAGVPASRVAAALPDRKVRHLAGVTAQSDVTQALVQHHPSVSSPKRWFTEEPLVSDDGLYVITKMFGTDSENVMKKLVALAPSGSIGFAAHEEA